MVKSAPRSCAGGESKDGLRPVVLAVFKKDPMKKERKLKPFQIIESGFTEEDNAALLTLEIEPDPRDPLKVKIDGTVYPVWVAQKEIKRLIKWLEKAAAQ